MHYLHHMCFSCALSLSLVNNQWLGRKKKKLLGPTLVQWGNVWVLHVMMWYLKCVCMRVCVWARTLVCTHAVHGHNCVHIPAECKHIRRLPVWRAKWGTIYSEREGCRNEVIERSKTGGGAQNDADPERKKRRDSWGESDETTKGGRGEIWGCWSGWRENNKVNESWRPDEVTAMRGSEEVCWFTAANWVENLKRETRPTHWQDK